MTDFLFATPSFVSGMGNVFDLGGTMRVFNDSSSPADADALALFCDWAVTGNDIREAAERVRP